MALKFNHSLCTESPNLQKTCQSILCNFSFQLSDNTIRGATEKLQQLSFFRTKTKLKLRYDNTLTCTSTTDLPNIYYELLTCEKSNSSNSRTCPPDLCTESAEEISNSSNLHISQNDANVFSSQDEKSISILQDLQQNSSSETNSSSKRSGEVFLLRYGFWFQSESFDGYRNKYSRERARFCFDLEQN